jgi:hypothetical protein
MPAGGGEIGHRGRCSLIATVARRVSRFWALDVLKSKPYLGFGGIVPIRGQEKSLKAGWSEQAGTFAIEYVALQHAFPPFGTIFYRISCSNLYSPEAARRRMRICGGAGTRIVVTAVGGFLFGGL